MAYEYEAMISNSISKNKDYFFTTTAKDMKDELQEVYRKARAFDEILNLPDTYGYAEEYAEDVDIILSEYMEDE